MGIIKRLMFIKETQLQLEMKRTELLSIIHIQLQEIKSLLELNNVITKKNG